MTVTRETIAQELAPIDRQGKLAEAAERAFTTFNELLRAVDEAIGAVLDARVRGVAVKDVVELSADVTKSLTELRELADRYLASPCPSMMLSDSVIEMRDRAMHARAHLIEATRTEINP